MRIGFVTIILGISLLAGCSQPASVPAANSNATRPTVVIQATATPPSAASSGSTKEGTAMSLSLNDVKQYFAQKPTETQDLGNGLKIGFMHKGDGPVVKAGDQVTIHYEGRLTNGTVFDSSVSRGQPLQSPIGVGRLIKGWDQAVVGRHVGDVFELQIPYQLAYGEQGYPPVIPPKSDLIFKIAVLGTK